MTNPSPTQGMEEMIAMETLERYSGSAPAEFQSNLILTNFPRYVKYFAESRKVGIKEGSMFKVAHCEEEDISILDFKIGSPAAALVVDICSFLPTRAAIFLGMCGGLRRRYKVGEYLASHVPALANFLMQKAVTDVLEKENIAYHIGTTYTTNMRFWEYNQGFIEELKRSKAQGIEMEGATLFAASYYRKFTLGALMLISDLPLMKEGIKTKKSSNDVFTNHTEEHVETGIKVLRCSRVMQARKVKGAYHRNLNTDIAERKSFF